MPISTVVAVDARHQPLAEVRGELLGGREREAARLGGAHHGLRQRMLRALLGAGRRSQHLVLASAPSSATTSVTSKRPRVSVPVLSNATARTRPSASMKRPPLNRMPLRAALAIADRMVAGVAITSAHGEATTSSVIAR